MKRTEFLHALVFGGAGGTGALARAADWPQWRGPQRNGISGESVAWPRGGPKKLWSAQVGEGFSAVAVVGNRVYTMGFAKNKDNVWCLDASTGKSVWSADYPCSQGQYGGPRVTPTVAGGNVYTLSHEGLALCLNAASGKQLWQNNLGQSSQPLQWGFAGSPLIVGDAVIYNVGAAGAATGKTSGKTLWSSGGGPAGYASPVSLRGGVALFTGAGLTAINPANGRALWSFTWDTQYQVNAADPIFSGDSVFISSNYEKGCALLRLGGGRPTVVWQNRNMRNHFNSCVLVGASLYGNDQNTLKCLDWKTGKERWQQRGIGKGGLIAAGDTLITLTERGMLVFATAAPDKYTELGSAQVIRGTNWTHPVLANGRIYCRSHEGELVCMDMSGK